MGAPVGIELGQYAFSRQVGQDEDYDPAADVQEWGSIMMVVATDAPLSDRNLERIARRAIMGLGRTGSYASNGSGDYVIAFSTANAVRRGTGGGVSRFDDLANGGVSALFEAVVEATEESIYNSLFRAETVTSNGRTVEALPLDETVEVLRRYGVSGAVSGHVLTDFDWGVRTLVYERFATTGAAPEIAELAARAGSTEHRIVDSLRRLYDGHEIAVHDDGRVWMANPFSAVPTDYPVETPEMTCWANCAWDALGVPAILSCDGWTRTKCAESGVAIEFGVRDGRLEGDPGVIHLVTPLRDAWVDIGFT